MNFRPLYDNILVKRIEAVDKTSAGLYIPDSAKDKPQEAHVLAVGPGRVGDDGKLHKMTIQEGNRVLFGKFSGSDFKLEGEEHLILRESDVLAIIER
jgi:chaperonin GroES